MHLHRRAGFAASWGELQRDLADGSRGQHRPAAGRQAPACRCAVSPRSSSESRRVLGEAAVASSDTGRLKAWWFYRLLFSPDPLGERLTLMWHNHFATSILKVGDPAAMRRQNETFRRLARKPFGELLEAMVRDPALLIWLDAPANRKGHPNENLARELMELFTLGIGHYTESDVKETARALTGWTVSDGEFREAAARHDDGAKTILGKSGRLERRRTSSGSCWNTPATADRLAWRLCDLFMGEGAVSKADLMRWPTACGRTSSTSAGRSRRCSDRGPSSPRRTSADPRPRARSSSSSARCAAWSCSTRRRARWCWPTGRPAGAGPLQPAQRRRLAGRPELAVGPLADRPRQLRRGTRRRAEASAATCRSTRSRWRARTAADATDAEPIRFCAELLLGIVPEDRWIERLGQSLGAKSKAAWNEDAARRAVARILARRRHSSVIAGSVLIIPEFAQALSQGVPMLTRRDLLKSTAERRGAGGLQPDRADLPGPDGRRGRASSATAACWWSSSSTAATTRSTRWSRSAMRATPSIATRSGSSEKSLIKVNDQVGLAPGPARDGEASGARPARAGAGRGLSQPEPLALREHGDLADGAARPGGAHRAGLDRPGLGRSARGEPRREPGGAAALFIGDGTPPGRAARPTRRDVGPGSDRRPHPPRGIGPAPSVETPAIAGRSRRWPRRLRPPERPRCLCRLGARGRADPRPAAARARYPDTALAGRLQTVAQLLKADLGARVFYTIQSGYDTHAGQSNTHYSLLFELGGAVKAFLDDLTAAKLADRVMVLGFSEFGRRVAENSSAGTDHGTAGLVFLAGPGVRAGVHGKVPSLTDLVDGDPKISTDFRRVYAAVLEDWLGLPSRTSLGSSFEPMPLFRPALVVRPASEFGRPRVFQPDAGRVNGRRPRRVAPPVSVSARSWRSGLRWLWVFLELCEDLFDVAHGLLVRRLSRAFVTELLKNRTALLVIIPRFLIPSPVGQPLAKVEENRCPGHSGRAWRRVGRPPLAGGADGSLPVTSGRLPARALLGRTPDSGRSARGCAETKCWSVPARRVASGAPAIADTCLPLRGGLRWTWRGCCTSWRGRS